MRKSPVRSVRERSPLIVAVSSPFDPMSVPDENPTRGSEAVGLAATILMVPLIVPALS